ncbi:MAG: hypothetical protein ABI947_08815 [Chloroflexota bacterium]
MNPAKEAHEVANEGPHPFDSIDMNFADAVTIVIACPFFLGMTNRLVRAVNVVIAAPFIGIDVSTIRSKVLDMGT